MRRVAALAAVLLLAGCAQLEYKRPADPVWAYRIDDLGAIVYWPNERLCDAARAHRPPCQRALITDGSAYWAVTLYGRDGEHGWAFKWLRAIAITENARTA